jgi:hypothetical protein
MSSSGFLMPGCTIRRVSTEGRGGSANVISRLTDEFPDANVNDWCEASARCDGLDSALPCQRRRSVRPYCEIYSD